MRPVHRSACLRSRMSESHVRLAIRRRVKARAGQLCEYCRAPDAYSPASFCSEHILPLSRGGSSNFDNLAFACSGCNAHKSDRVAAQDPLSGHTTRLFHPRLDRWSEHFMWSSNYLQVVGRTDVGRATITCLKLNRANLQNLRLLLLKDGKHPPTDD